jgi:hypothetical protein
MSPRRETYRTIEGRNVVLFADINDALSVLLPAHHSRDRNSRRERAWTFRGQRNAEWKISPSLYRPPADAQTVAQRIAYTNSFIQALRSASVLQGKSLTELEYLAIAQHYEFYTPLIDFSWNVEVAAYFATRGGRPGDIGVICAFNAEEYSRLRNPFSAFGISQREADDILRDGALPHLVTFGHDGVPRIWQQEGLFFHLPSQSIETFNRECIDRWYFRQRAGLVYAGDFPHSRHLLMGRHAFVSQAAYDGYVEAVRREHPNVFDRTAVFDGNHDLFPPIDDLSRFAVEWKIANPSPYAPSHASAPAAAELLPTGLAVRIDAYYFGESNRSPYQRQYLATGRRLVESLARFEALNSSQALSWLLWELLRWQPEEIKATLKLDDASGSNSGEEGLRVTIIDRWLGTAYDCTLDWDHLVRGFRRITFGKSRFRGRTEVEIVRAEPIVPPESVHRQRPCNPFEPRGADLLVESLKSELHKLERGVLGSFLYDLHGIVLQESGRNLELTAGIVDRAPCMQRSRLIPQDHTDGPSLLVRVHDRFAGGITHTAVCPKHWRCMSAADWNLFSPWSWTMLGLA